MLVIAVPALLIWIFFSNDYPFAEKFGTNYQWSIKFAIGIAFIIGSFLLTLLLVSMKMLDISIFMFSLPIAISFMTIFITDSLVPWARALIVITAFLLVIPISIVIKKIEIKLIIKKKEKENEKIKIIGHKDK